MRTREGMAITRANGKAQGKQPKLNPRQRAHPAQSSPGGTHAIAEIAELFSVRRATVYREIARAGRRPASFST
jgi:DNA invertase Pin-like site-specific DNA recombinase